MPVARAGAAAPRRYTRPAIPTFLDRAKSRIPQPWRTVLDWSITLALVIGFVLAFEAEVAKPFRIPTASMEPTLHCAKPGPWCLGSHDDRVLVNRLAYRFGSPRRGQMIVFNAPPASVSCAGEKVEIFVKRLIGLPGEQVSERNGYVFIDRKRLAEPYVDPSLRDHGTHVWPRVPDDRYFFLGDDRAHSCDSRTWGTVRRGSLIGRVLVTYWPPSRVAIH